MTTFLLGVLVIGVIIGAGMFLLLRQKLPIKTALGGLFIGLVSSVLWALATIFIDKPFFIYEIVDTPGGFAIRMENIGFTPADETAFELSFANPVLPKPMVRAQYWTKPVKVSDYFVFTPNTSPKNASFDDKGDLDEFARGELLEVMFSPQPPAIFNKITGRKFKVLSIVEGRVWKVDAIDKFRFAYNGLSIFALITLVIFCGYLLGQRQGGTNQNEDLNNDPA